MRGLAVVLVLVCLASSALAAATCNNGGKQSTDASGCLCVSGFAGASCNTVGDNTCVSKQLVQTEATFFPNLAEGTADPLTSPIRFVGNTLYARILGNYVEKRAYQELEFVRTAAMVANSVALDDRCRLGNTASFWSQGLVAAPTCNDTFQLTMPWSEHPKCGFANNTAKSNSEWMYISGYLYIKYTDALGEVDGFNLTRSTKVPYAVSVKFQRHVTVQLVALNVTSDVKYGMALTEDTYDPEKGHLKLEITSIVNWPNKFWFGDALNLYKPNQVLPLKISTASTGTPLNVIMCPGGVCPSGEARDIWAYDEKDMCSDAVEKSLCTQKFVLIAELDQLHKDNCTYDGRFDIISPLYTCRDQTTGSQKPDCTSAFVNITFHIQDSWVCGMIGVAPHVEGKLHAFDPQYTSGFAAMLGQNGKEVTNFQLGKYGHFYAAIQSDDNTLSLEFRDISFTVQGQSNWVRLYNSSGWHAPVGADASFTDSYPAQPALVPGFVVPDHKYFRVYFHSSVFKVNPNSQVLYTFRATIDLSFKGNDHFVDNSELKKRTIETTWEQSVTSAETNVFMRAAPAGQASPVAPAKELPSENGVSSVTFIASVVGAVAGTMIIVFVVVGFALRARSASKDEPSASLVAASAAAAEVANRA